jgi:regulator of sigma E protease
MYIFLFAHKALKIIIGLFGLGIVVFIHELGHFLAARFTGINVEAFSIGWGRPILKKKIGTVEYRLGMFPVGGYCKMKGESDYHEAWENMQKGVKAEEGSYLASNPASRILVSFAGPFFNLVFAVLVLSILWGIGFEINTLGNRIVLASEVKGDQEYPADFAGLQTGDRIIEINGNKTSYYHEIQEKIAINPEKTLAVKVERGGELLNLNVTPALDKSSGAGKIGIYFWTDPVVGNVKEASPAQNAGLLPGDRILYANDIPLRNTLDLTQIAEQNPEKIILEYQRDDVIGQAVFSAQDFENDPGFAWASIHYHTGTLNPVSAIVKGTKESYKTLTVSFKSLRLLFKGIDLTNAVSGPARITYMMGDMAAQGFEQGIGTALRSITDFLALVSIALCVMNLLPLPILDGGMILLFLVELIRGKPAHPKAITVFQTFGIVLICGLMLFAVFGDIMFFVRQ